MFVPLCSAHAHGGTKIVDFAKTSIFVQSCSVLFRARTSLNEQKWGKTPIIVSRRFRARSRRVKQTSQNGVREPVNKKAARFCT